jgi:hypothetical protein
MTKNKTYKGIDLIEKIIEFTAMTPDSATWTYNSLKENEPRLIRLKQIDSLISAFIPEIKNTNLTEKLTGLLSSKKTKLTKVVSGEFIENRCLDAYIAFTNLIKQEAESSTLNKIDITDIKNTFIILMSYKKNLRQLINFNNDWLEVSRITSLFSIKLTNKISSNLLGQYDELDKVLELIINPKNLSFSETELISNYNFPKDDLDEIDLDNW